jgi:hypothetical protein
MAAVASPAAPRPARWPLLILVVLGVVAAALVAAWLKTRSG